MAAQLQKTSKRTTCDAASVQEIHHTSPQPRLMGSHIYSNQIEHTPAEYTLKLRQ